MDIIESLYYLGMSIKKKHSLKNRRRLPHKVISIGNLTVGGTGKTPAAIAVAQEALKRDLRPVILTRGYKGSVQGPCFVTKGDTPLLTPQQAGDEPFLMAEKLSGVPVVKGSNRYAAGLFAATALGATDTADPGRAGNAVSGSKVFILDDGFQHWGLHRDMDIVLIDGNNPFGNRKLFPMGILREPVSSLSRADVIVVTKNERHPDGNRKKLNDGLEKEIRKFNEKAPIFVSEHIPESLRQLTGEKRPVNWLQDKKIFAFCAIGRPESFLKTLKQCGAHVVGFETFRDHYRYSNSDLLQIKERADKTGAGWIVTTEKDIIKIRDLDLPGNIIIIEIAFSAENDFYNKIFGF